MLGIVNLHADAGTWDCTQGLRENWNRVCAESLFLLHQGIQPASASSTLGPMLKQLGYMISTFLPHIEFIPFLDAEY